MWDFRWKSVTDAGNERLEIDEKKGREKKRKKKKITTRIEK